MNLNMYVISHCCISTVCAWYALPVPVSLSLICTLEFRNRKQSVLNLSCIAQYRGAELAATHLQDLRSFPVSLSCWRFVRSQIASLPRICISLGNDLQGKSEGKFHQFSVAAFWCNVFVTLISQKMMESIASWSHHHHHRTTKYSIAIADSEPRAVAVDWRFGEVNELCKFIFWLMVFSHVLYEVWPALGAFPISVEVIWVKILLPILIFSRKLFVLVTGSVICDASALQSKILSLRHIGRVHCNLSVFDKVLRCCFVP